MPTGLKRYQHKGHLHFITFSCYRRLPYLSEPGAYTTLELALEETRRRHSMQVHGYVFMPEHLHLLVSEPPQIVLADALKYFKWSTSRRVAHTLASATHTVGAPYIAASCDVWELSSPAR